jgi:hypothetical protein
MKGKALRRALATKETHRLAMDLPLIVDTTEIITPNDAKVMLERNQLRNRPINWQRVEQYAAEMRAGNWKLHAQGIVLDGAGNVLTGQKRLWAVIHANVSVPFRVSRGSPQDVARLLDRHTPQSSTDLATRDTGRKHSPMESSIARAVLVLRNNLRPSKDELADVIVTNSDATQTVLRASAGTRKTPAILMVLAVATTMPDGQRVPVAQACEIIAASLSATLSPQTADKCWGRGAAFGLAMGVATKAVKTWIGGQK